MGPGVVLVVGASVAELTRLKHLEEENRKLKQMFVDLRVPWLLRVTAHRQRPCIYQRPSEWCEQ
jgi:hypothetical protein